MYHVKTTRWTKSGPRKDASYSICKLYVAIIYHKYPLKDYYALDLADPSNECYSTVENNDLRTISPQKIKKTHIAIPEHAAN